MMKVVLFFVFLLVLIPFNGCFKKVQYVDTPSGRPEVVIRKASKQEVFSHLIKAMGKKGYKKNQVKNSIAEFTKRSKIKNKTQDGRVRFKITNTALGVRVLASLHRISNPGTPHQKIKDISKNSKDAIGLQGILEAIKDNLEGYFIKSF